MVRRGFLIVCVLLAQIGCGARHQAAASPFDPLGCRSPDECVVLLNSMKGRWSQCSAPSRDCPTWDQIMAVTQRVTTLRADESRVAQERAAATQLARRRAEANDRSDIEGHCSEVTADCRAASASIHAQLDQTQCRNDPHRCAELRSQARLVDSMLGKLQDRDSHAAAQAVASERDAQEIAQFETVESQEDKAIRLATEKEYAIPAISVLICRRENDLADLHAKMAREAAITQTSGVMDMSERRDIAESMQDAQDEIRGLRAALLKTQRAQPLPCVQVKTTLSCVAEKRDCSDVDAIRADIIDYAEDVLRGKLSLTTAIAPNPTAEHEPHGSLLVQVDGAKVTVKLEGVRLGTTPLVIERLRPGPVELELSDDSGQSKHLSAAVRANARLTVETRM